jgi:hypothetical protein
VPPGRRAVPWRGDARVLRQVCGAGDPCVPRAGPRDVGGPGALSDRGLVAGQLRGGATRWNGGHLQLGTGGGGGKVTAAGDSGRRPHAENVVAAVQRVRPYAVDVSSGVEAAPAGKTQRNCVRSSGGEGALVAAGTGEAGSA